MASWSRYTTPLAANPVVLTTGTTAADADTSAVMYDATARSSLAKSDVAARSTSLRSTVTSETSSTCAAAGIARSPIVSPSTSEIHGRRNADHDANVSPGHQPAGDVPTEMPVMVTPSGTITTPTPWISSTGTTRPPCAAVFHEMLTRASPSVCSVAAS